MMPPIAGVATSQTADNSVVSSQVQQGDVTSSQTLDVVTVTDTTAGTTTATGDSITAGSDVGSLDVRSTQSMQGAATTTLNVETDGAAGDVGITTAATGNTGEADSLGGAPLTGNLRQSTGPNTISAVSRIEAADGQTGDVVDDTQAIGNTMGVAVAGSTATVSVSQSATGSTVTDGGMNLGYSPGEADLAASSVSNNITATGLDGGSQTLTLNQSMTGTMTQSAQFVAVGQAQAVNNATTASANNISVSNDGGPLDVVAAQDNQGYVRGQAESTAFSFGTSSAVASGVGNSAIYGETGGPITLNSSQTNSGAGVEAVASSGGAVGYDLTSSATAMGNAVTGYACSACGGVMNVASSQSNTADIGATSSIPYAGTAGAVRSAISTATAVGNSATFYVSRPSN